jgi:hypothetical protein
MEEEIRNRVSDSGIITVYPEEYIPKGERVCFDLAPLLFQGMILREKDLREHIKTHNWEQYRDKFVNIQCSTEAIIPSWAYMLIASALVPFAAGVFYGKKEEMENALYRDALLNTDLSHLKDARVVIKGCGEGEIPANAYVLLTSIIRPIARSIMFGEPCSTVPVYKRPG